jgi:hypothetical protein
MWKKYECYSIPSTNVWASKNSAEEKEIMYIYWTQNVFVILA